MWTCPKCEAAVDDGFDICWGCGGDRDGCSAAIETTESEGVMSSTDFEATHAAETNAALIPVCNCASDYEAHVLRSRLEAEGIHAIVLDELASTTWPWGLVNDREGIKVLVGEKDLEQARRVLAEDAAQAGKAGEDEE